MSFIRALQNPERLHIVKVGNVINILGKQGTLNLEIPNDAWEEVCIAYTEGKVEYIGDKFEFDGLSLECVKGLKFELRWKDTAILMWEVTWEFIISRYRD